MADETPLSFTIKKASKSDPRPRSTTPRARAKVTDETVEKAVAVMNNVYRAVGVGLLFAQLPESAEALADEKDKLETANRDAFQASPKLAEFIGNAGSVSTVATFFIAHVFAGAGVVATARKEMAKREPKQKKTRTENTTETDSQNDDSTQGNVAGILYGIPSTVATG